MVNSYNDNNQNNNIFWKNDVVTLTGYIIKFVENHIDGPILKEFHQGTLLVTGYWLLVTGYWLLVTIGTRAIC